MEVSLNPSLLTQLPELKIGIIHYTKIVVAESPQMIKGRLQLYQENLYLEMQDQPVTEREGIAEWRQLWKQLGADPNRYRHSAESLMRRVSKQNYLTPLHSGVDLNNFFSLQYEIPVGIYDIAHLKGNIEIALGNEETGYEGLNGRFNTLNHILFSRDEEGLLVHHSLIHNVQLSLREQLKRSIFSTFALPLQLRMRKSFLPLREKCSTKFMVETIKLLF
ncbi:hypothetical protein LSPH24S_00781 [Lysinibacillus sphaericus]